MRAVLLLCLAAYVTAQTPQPCMSPKQWEGRVFRMDRSKNFTEMGRITVDESNERFRIIEEREVGSDRDYYDTLFLHNIKKEYRLNLKTRQCNVTDLLRPYRPMGVPPFAKFVFEAEIGAAAVDGEHMTIQAWEGEFRDKSKFLNQVTVPDCVPTSSGFFSNETGFVVSTYYDTNLGVSDPTVFIPPTECNK